MSLQIFGIIMRKFGFVFRVFKISACQYKAFTLKKARNFLVDDLSCIDEKS